METVPLIDLAESQNEEKQWSNYYHDGKKTSNPYSAKENCIRRQSIFLSFFFFFFFREKVFISCELCS